MMDRKQVFVATTASKYASGADGRPRTGNLRVIVETDDLSRPMADRIISLVDGVLSTFSHPRMRRQAYRSELLGAKMAIEINEVQDEEEIDKKDSGATQAESTDGNHPPKPVAAQVSGGAGKNRKRPAGV